MRRGLGRAHAVDRVLRLEASDGGLVLRHLGHFVGGPRVERLWVHLAGELVVERRKLRLRTADEQGLRLDELAELLAEVAADQVVVMLDLDPATEPAAVEGARALDWGAATLRVIGPDATARLVAALDGGARSAGALCEAIGEGASSDDPGAVLGAAGPTAPVGDAGALAAVVEYLEGLRARCREIPLHVRDPAVGDAADIYVPLWTTSPADRQHGPRDPRRALGDPRHALDKPNVVPQSTVHDRVAAHRCVFVVGEPGSGKTTTLRRLCAALCDAHLARDGAARPAWMPERPLPVWLDLRTLPTPTTDARRDPAALLDHAFAHLPRRDRRELLPAAVADRALEDGRLILILDGLDEIATPTLRRRWAEAITTLAEQQARPARVWVSCREAARAAGAEPGAPFVRVDLQPLDHDQRRRVITGWLRAKALSPATLALEAKALLADLTRHPAVEEQTGSPLFLAMVCLLYYRGRGLPDSRVELYGQLIELFLTDREREREEVSPIAAIPPYRRRQVLTELAWRWWAESVAFASGGLLQGRCAAITAEGLSTPPIGRKDERSALAEALVAFFDQRAGLLRWEETDGRTGQRRLGFAHRTFGEFLVACRLSHDPAARAAHQSERYARDDGWREVFVMFTALIGRAETGDRKPAWDWIKTLAAWATDTARPAEDRACFARLAAECLAPCRDRSPSPEAVAAVDGLQEILLDATRCAGFDAAQRISFWKAIGRHNRLVTAAADRWVMLASGRFWRGAAEGDGLALADERPAGWVEVSEFAIQRWPVLVMEYAAFVEGGYGDRDGERPPWWSPEGWAWRRAERVEHPANWYEQRQGGPTHPVVGVSFYEAEAYASWLGHTGQGPGPGVVALPSEAQWERAARGLGPDSARRRYPWGWNDNPDRRNVELAHSGATPIGAFPGGRSVDGLWTMCGDVWEWCVDGGVQPYDPHPPADPVRSMLSGRVLRVLRGGVRVSIRNGGHPALRRSDIGFRCVWRRASKWLEA